MKKRTKTVFICIILLILLILTLLIIHYAYANYSTGVPAGEVVLHHDGKEFSLTSEEAEQMRKIFRFKFYDLGIGGCYYEEGTALSFGDRKFAIALDGCYTAKEWDAERYMRLSSSEFEQIADLFKKYWEDTPFYIYSP